MANDADLRIKWVKVGILTGLLASVTYPLLIFVEMPTSLTITLAEVGLIDLGPFVGLWYLVVTVQIFRSLRWVEESLA